MEGTDNLHLWPLQGPLGTGETGREIVKLAPCRGRQGWMKGRALCLGQGHLTSGIDNCRRQVTLRGASKPGGPEEGCVRHEGSVLSRRVQTHWLHSQLSGSASERQCGLTGRSLKIPVG